VVLQSAEVVHCFGHGSMAGLRQRPGTFKLDSTELADVQQTSPSPVWQSALVPQVFGHWFAGRQIDWV
jgi:hypothetical protein